MAWLSIRLSLPAARVEALADLLTALGAESVAVRDAANAPVLEPAPGEMPLWPQAELDALFPLDSDVASIRAQLTEELGESRKRVPLDVRFVQDADWLLTWRNHAVEHCFGGRLWVLPCDAPMPADDAAVLRIDPGLAFGTGGHATTAMCLDWLARRRVDGWSVVDYGAGSGILGIAALLLGAGHAVCVDHDPQACLATRANATYNGIASERITIIAPDGLAMTSHDLVLANILAGPLMTLAPVLTRLVRPGGALVMSGVLDHQLDAVTAHYPGFRFEPAQVRESWVMVQGIRTRG
jgi:ribosomal protein L11 methyltransferase